ncbi:hypothetical protein M1L60_40505 [Actinoplanes sp. TRM 88003]|uniref:Secreted protein n=1 Tax=Paractinoplanes aksuensis TaxID=2939490 RepID=A0ABT1E4Z6_9ACTN|nr:hypothetical protein [Actinoplanes aksuensis]MCO8276881.1 hypothetical protein [Actinoplanes aksuensis]
MSRIALVAAVVAAAGIMTARRPGRRRADTRSWHSMTVYRTLDDVSANLPDQLCRLEVQLTPAPGGRGAEIRARGDRPDAEVRRILRLSRSLLEVGEVRR